MSKIYLKFNNVSFGYENSINNILNEVSFQLSQGWTGLIGANGAGKSTLLKLACGLFSCTKGTIEAPSNRIYNEQRTDTAPDRFDELLQSYDNLALKLIGELAIQHDWITCWNTLSHGERKRVQTACSLFNHPDLLALDEPTNHLDQPAKEMIINSIKSFAGIGLLVSHDRDLLENLCNQFLFFDREGIDLRHGKLSEILARRKAENDYAIKQMELRKNEVTRLSNEFRRRSENVDKSTGRISKKHIDKNDKDAKAKIDLARLTGKDKTAGKLKQRMQSRLENAKEELLDVKIRREFQTGIILSDSVSKRNYLLNLDPGELNLSSDKTLSFGNIVISPQDKIALKGINGSGKSTFIRYILNKINAEPENITYIPQEISVEETRLLLDKVKSLPNDELGKLLIIVSRLGSDAKRILETELPSPGETRKLMLGLGITKKPHIIIMDEPTNHMDIVSIECLEEALKQVSCALLLVSHDFRFLSSLTNTEWSITNEGNNYRFIN